METLFVPWVLLSLTICVVLCLIIRWWKMSIVVLVVVLGVNCKWQVFSCGLSPLYEAKSEGCIRVMTWNICCANTSMTDDVDGLISVILRQDADVVFLTEYVETYMPKIDSVMKAHYPYKGSIENWRICSDFYSRMPIDSCRLIEGQGNGCKMRYDLRIAEKYLSLYCVHMQSNNQVNGGMFYPDSIQDRKGVLQYLKNYETAAEIRREQAGLLVADFEDVPTIVIGDMNDVYGSPCLRVFEDAGLKDAWWKGGFGYGATIHDPLPYRIDHVMYSVGLKLMGIKRVDAKGLSDHDALVVVLTPVRTRVAAPALAVRLQAEAAVPTMATKVVVKETDLRTSCNLRQRE